MRTHIDAARGNDGGCNCSGSARMKATATTGGGGSCPSMFAHSPYAAHGMLEDTASPHTQQSMHSSNVSYGDGDGGGGGGANVEDATLSSSCTTPMACHGNAGVTRTATRAASSALYSNSNNCDDGSSSRSRAGASGDERPPHTDVSSSANNSNANHGAAAPSPTVRVGASAREAVSSPIQCASPPNVQARYGRSMRAAHPSRQHPLRAAASVPVSAYKTALHSSAVGNVNNAATTTVVGGGRGTGSGDAGSGGYGMRDGVYTEATPCAEDGYGYSCSNSNNGMHGLTMTANTTTTAAAPLSPQLSRTFSAAQTHYCNPYAGMSMASDPMRTAAMSSSLTATATAVAAPPASGMPWTHDDVGYGGDAYATAATAPPYDTRGGMQHMGDDVGGAAVYDEKDGGSGGTRCDATTPSPPPPPHNRSFASSAQLHIQQQQQQQQQQGPHALYASLPHSPTSHGAGDGNFAVPTSYHGHMSGDVAYHGGNALTHAVADGYHSYDSHVWRQAQQQQQQRSRPLANMSPTAPYGFVGSAPRSPMMHMSHAVTSMATVATLYGSEGDTSASQTTAAGGGGYSDGQRGHAALFASDAQYNNNDGGGGGSGNAHATAAAHHTPHSPLSASYSSGRMAYASRQHHGHHTPSPHHLYGSAPRSSAASAAPLRSPHTRYGGSSFAFATTTSMSTTSAPPPPSTTTTAATTTTMGLGAVVGMRSSNGAADADTASVSSRAGSNASSVRDNLPLCPNDESCASINDSKHQRQYAHTCRLFPCYHGHITRHAKLFRHVEGQVAQPEGVVAGRMSTHALTSVNFSSISPEAANAYRIYVLYGEKSYEIFGDWANVRVHTFKRYLHQVCHITPQAQVLVLLSSNKVMDDEISAVKAYGVEQDAVIQLKLDIDMDGGGVGSLALDDL